MEIVIIFKDTPTLALNCHMAEVSDWFGLRKRKYAFQIRKGWINVKSLRQVSITSSLHVLLSIALNDALANRNTA
jgi:hypothetical protein